jgi:Xaa-Pro aminopeptidase
MMTGLCHALVVTKPANLLWLSGFSASNMAAAVTAGALIIATDRRYSEALEQHLDLIDLRADVRVGRNVLGLVLDAVGGDVDSIGLEAHHVTWRQQQAVTEHLDGAVPVVATDGVIEQARAVKDAGELDRLRRSAAIADRALATVIADLPARVTERDIARRLEAEMVAGGADEPSFPTIVAAGSNSARPHAVPSDRPLESGDLLVIDMGARLDGYGSDMTRSFAVDAFTAETEVIHRAVALAQAAGVAAVTEGVVVNVVDAACRDLLTDLGLGAEFTHGTGHGIGLEIHEQPFLSAGNEEDVLVAGNVVTVEPGVYRPGVGGVRIEDSVIVTADGCRPITLSPKEPLVSLGG